MDERIYNSDKRMDDLREDLTMLQPNMVATCNILMPLMNLILFLKSNIVSCHYSSSPIGKIKLYFYKHLRKEVRRPFNLTPAALEHFGINC